MSMLAFDLSIFLNYDKVIKELIQFIVIYFRLEQGLQTGSLSINREGTPCLGKEVQSTAGGVQAISR